MGKHEMMFQEKMGERIKELREKKGFKREELHDLIFPDLKKISPNSKYRNVYNWEKGANAPSYEVLNKLCDIFECDSDYLLCRQNNPLQIYDYIEDITHFSREAIDNIYDGSDDFLNVLNFLIENPSLIKQIQHCATVKYEFQKVPITQNANTPFRWISFTDRIFISDEQLFQADTMNVYNTLLQYIKKLRTDKGLKIYGSE